MHGMIHANIKKYVETKYDSDTWAAVLAEAGFGGKIYSTLGTYPDEEAVAIVGAASRLTGLTVDQILEDFGEFLFPKLMNLYKGLTKPNWKTQDMLLNTETMIHRVLRRKNPDIKPPNLQFTQIAPQKLGFFYDSPRRMSAVARGMIKGVAKYYGETATIQEKKNADGSVEMSITIN